MGRLEKFFQTFDSESTIKAYKWALRKFFMSVYGEGNLEEQAKKYFVEKRNYEDDVMKFFSQIKGRPALTVRSALSAVKVFLMEQGVELPQLFWRRLRRRKKGTRALTQDKVPETAELRKILSHMGAKGRALYLVLVSSGMRIGEALKLHIGDIDLNHAPPKISIRGAYTKTGNPRIAFISREAREALEEWLKIRGQYLITASKRSRYAKATEDKRVFPYQSATALLVWQNACKKAGFDKKDSETGRFEVHPHVLRKFFRSKLGEVIPTDIVEALMGHEGYLTDVYRRHSEKDLAKYYIRGEKQVCAFAEAGDAAKLRQEITSQVSTQLDAVTDDNVKLKEGLQRLEERMKRYEAFTRKFMKLSPEKLEKIAMKIMQEEVDEAQRAMQEQIEHDVKEAEEK